MKKIWLIGASEGIGRALALELSKDPENFLILSARNRERLINLSSVSSCKMLLIPLNVQDEITISYAWKEIKNKMIAIDVIIYCAGYYKPMSSASIDLEEVKKIIDVNLMGAIRLMNIIVPEFILQKNGHIVLIGSLSGYRGLPNSFGYGISKAGIIHLAENLACDLSRYGIKVQVINPGFVKTRLTDLNQFTMPFILSTEKAAMYIVKIMKKNVFESRFPFWFGHFMKLMSRLPYWIYFFILKVK